jgi:hypothetical protein
MRNCFKLPDWDNLTNFYGPPVILGLETCQTFRETVAPKDLIVAITGSFNSGTDLVTFCVLPTADSIQQDTLHILMLFSVASSGCQKRRGGVFKNYVSQSNLTKLLIWSLYL